MFLMFVGLEVNAGVEALAFNVTVLVCVSFLCVLSASPRYCVGIIVLYLSFFKPKACKTFLFSLLSLQYRLKHKILFKICTLLKR